MASFTSRRAFVTGAGSGIGKATAQKLLKEGAQVAFVDINESAIAGLVSEEDNAVAVESDVTDKSSVIDAVNIAVEALGGLDIVVNNAGIVRSGTLQDLSLEEWEEVFAVNSTGAFLVSKASAPHLARAATERGDGATSAIVNVTSIEAHIVFSPSGSPTLHYNASKGALLQLTRALAVECASGRIRVNAVAPGFIETPFTEEARANPEVVKFVLERTPLGRIGKPEDIANGVAFLASDEASWVTGTTLFIDGGWMVL